MQRCYGLIACLALSIVIDGAAQTAQSAQGAAAPGPSAPPAQAPGPRPASTDAPAPTARISGRVIAADTGKPLNRAQVRLNAPKTQGVRLTLTDPDGRFEFGELAEGRYGLAVSKPGYVSLEYGQLRPFDFGKLVVLTAGQSATDVDFALPRGSVIAGRITDEFGDPIAGAFVQALRYQYMPNGQRRLAPGMTGGLWIPSVTDDLGAFRIFGLVPGSYLVSAKVDAGIGFGFSPGADVVDSTDRQATTYYPGTSSIGEAQTVSVGLMNQAFVSFPIVPTRAARISGTIRDSQGRPATGGQVTLRSNGTAAGWFFSSGAGVQSGGRFEVTNVDPGEYTLEVRPTGPGGVASSSQATREFASVPITVDGEDIRDLLITTAPGVSIRGRVMFEGEFAPSVRSGVRISAVPEEDARNTIAGFGADGGAIDQDGRFEIQHVAGRVVFRPSSLPLPRILKSVTMNGVDITNTPIDVRQLREIGEIDVVLTDKEAALTGFVKNGRGETMRDCRVITFPTHLKEGDVIIRFTHNTSPDQTGRFRMGRMPAGEYVAAGMEGVVQGEQWDPEFRKRIEQSGRRFTLREGETLEIELPFLPRDDR